MLSCLYDKDINKLLRNLAFLLKEGGAYLCIDPPVFILGMSDPSILHNAVLCGIIDKRDKCGIVLTW